MVPSSPSVALMCAVALAAGSFSLMHGAVAGEAPKAEQVAKARAAIKGLGGNLKKELVAALKEGGPLKALDVCKTVAPSIAADQSQAHGLQIGRTALKVRNPDNAPDDDERAVLERFVAKIEAGADPKTLEDARVVTLAGGDKVLRYMKAIPTAEKPCLACHGETITPEVKAEIDRLYPQDEAIGFKAGELRGAFTVTQQIE